MNIFSELLTPERTLFKVSGRSRKRIFEVLASAFSLSVTEISTKEVYEGLLERERLGSTGLGMGVAIPHCRVESCITPMGVLASLDHELDFDSSDGCPVNLLFALIVPYHAHQDHLDILSEVAKLFCQESFCGNLRTAKSSLEMHLISTKWK
ncbi:MAG: PTS sugar transporter subunit IIA [Halieaceae bacterium]|nr:PTS sugar transporter subunit IIA [Halieaceae bacterium]